MLTLLVSFYLTASQVRASETEQVADLVRDHDICTSELYVCESALDKALSRNTSEDFFKDPMVITGSILTALVVGFVAGTVINK